MAFYVLFLYVVCCLFQSVFLFFSSGVSDKNTKVFYCVRKERRIPRVISWFCFQWEKIIFIIVFVLIVCVQTDTKYSYLVILIFLFPSKFALYSTFHF